jgi:hypothetical protein
VLVGLRQQRAVERRGVAIVIELGDRERRRDQQQPDDQGG